MGRFLFVGGEAGGDVAPLLAVVTEVARRGHDVDFLAVPWMPHQIADTELVDSLRRARARRRCSSGDVRLMDADTCRGTAAAAVRAARHLRQRARDELLRRDGILDCGSRRLPTVD